MTDDREFPPSIEGLELPRRTFSRNRTTPSVMARTARTIRARSRNIVEAYATRSKIPAAPIPPPTHIVTIP